MSEWGKAHINNTIGFGQGSENNSINWGSSYGNSFSGDTALASGGGGGFDPDYQAVLDYATAQGYTLPSAGQQALQNQLVLDLKAAGVWSKLDSFAVFATDGDSDYALIDWVRLATMTAVNAPTFTTNQGYETDGATSLIDANYNPSTAGGNMTLDDAHFAIYGENISGTGVVRGGGVYNGARLSSSNFNGMNGGNGSSGSLTIPNNYKLLIHTRDNSANFNRYADSTNQNVTQPSSSIMTEFVIGGDFFNFGKVNAKISSLGSNLNGDEALYQTTIENYLNNI